MFIRNKAVWVAVAVVLLVTMGYAKKSKLAGKIVAYDVMQHASKNTAEMQNQEVVILETAEPKRRYVKVMVSSFGTTQIEQKYFDGTLSVELDVLRDRSCDEKSPTLVPQVELHQIAGTYLLTDSFKTSPPGRIKSLECYVAIYKTK